MTMRHLLAAAVILSAAAHANVLYFDMPAEPSARVGDPSAIRNTLYLSGRPGVAGFVTSPSGFNQRFIIGPSGRTEIALRNADEIAAPGVVTNNGFSIRTFRPFDTVNGTYRHEDSAKLFDAAMLGTAYMVLSYPTNIVRGNPASPTIWPSEFSIVGTRNGTKVTITPSTPLYETGRPAGKPFTITLNAGQAVVYESGAQYALNLPFARGDVSGTQIKASAPVAVFGGSQCAGVPAAILTPYACGHMVEQLPPVSEFTRSAVVPPTPFAYTNGTPGNQVRVLASRNGTVVRWNGTKVAQLNAGEVYEFNAGKSGGVVTSSQPVLVGAFTPDETLDGPFNNAAEAWIPGIDQWLDRYFFDIAGVAGVDTGYLELALRTSDIASLVLNGNRVPGADCDLIPGTIFSSCEIVTQAGIGQIHARRPFLLLTDAGGNGFTFGGADLGGFFRTFALADDVPEPGTLSLVFAAAMGFVWHRRRKRARADRG